MQAHGLLQMTTFLAYAAIFTTFGIAVCLTYTVLRVVAGRAGYRWPDIPDALTLLLLGAWALGVITRDAVRDNRDGLIVLALIVGMVLS